MTRTAALALALVVPVLAGAVEYRVIDLGPPGRFTVSEAFCVNNAGQVSLMIDANVKLPYLWSEPTGFQFVGPRLYGRNSLAPYSLNDGGLVTGEWNIDRVGSFAFVWDPTGRFWRLPVLPGLAAGRGVRINSRGEVAGTCRGDAPDRAFFWSPGRGLEEVGVLHANGASRAYGMNDAGQVVGQASVDTGSGISFRAFLWTHEAGIRALPLPQGTVEAWGTGINSGGTIVGHAYDFNFNRYVFRIEPGGPPTILDRDFNWAFDVNDLGVILGDGRRGACTFDDFNGLVYLNEHLDNASLAWHLNEARSINESGWIAGVGSFQGFTRAFLAVPH